MSRSAARPPDAVAGAPDATAVDLERSQAGDGERGNMLRTATDTGRLS